MPKDEVWCVFKKRLFTLVQGGSFDASFQFNLNCFCLLNFLHPCRVTPSDGARKVSISTKFRSFHHCSSLFTTKVVKCPSSVRDLNEDAEDDRVGD